MKVAPNVKTQARCCKTISSCPIKAKMCGMASCGVHCASSLLLDLPINAYIIIYTYTYMVICSYVLGGFRRYEIFIFWQGSQRYASIWRLTMPSQRKLGHWNLPSKKDSQEPDCYFRLCCYEGWTKKHGRGRGISWYLMTSHDMSWYLTTWIRFHSTYSWLYQEIMSLQTARRSTTAGDTGPAVW